MKKYERLHIVNLKKITQQLFSNCNLIEFKKKIRLNLAEEAYGTVCVREYSLDILFVCPDYLRLILQ